MLNMAAPAKPLRFVTEADLDDKRKNIHSKRTIQGNTQAANMFREYLVKKAADPSFENFSKEELDGHLSRFYVDARKKDGTQYKTGSLDAVRHGLNRYLQAPPYNKRFDIIKDREFKNSNISFEAAKTELKQCGKGSITHYPAINDADMQQLYSSVYLSSTTPTGLFNKVQFDIRLYFCRRGAENMHTMTKDTFSVQNDPSSGLKFIQKSDEMTKNHRSNDKENMSGIMPENPGSPHCPVASFLKYKEKLHSECNRLWQRPKDSFEGEDDSTWYCNIPVGEKKLKSFMTELSEKCKLSQRYTNHSVSATSVTLLSRSKYSMLHK